LEEAVGLLSEIRGGKEDLALDVEELRRKLGPVKVGLIDLWIREVNGPYDALIREHTPEGSLLLDIGCSRGDPDLPSLKRARFSVGADLDLLGLRANTIDSACLLAPMSRLPFRDNTFDVVVCKWVLEHLEHPAQDLAEVRRVLKPGGALVALTPNKYSIFTVISAILSHRLKQILKGRMFGGHEEDTFATWYRANSRPTLLRLTRAAGLREVRFELLPGMFTFFIFSGPLARLVRRAELIQARVPGLRKGCTYLLAAWVKTEEGEIP